MGREKQEELTVIVPDENQCPLEIQQSLKRYVEHGIPPGSFLEAVLCNDLMQAFGRADHLNIEALPHICAYVYNKIPSSSHGSPEQYGLWLERVAKERLSKDDPE